MKILRTVRSDNTYVGGDVKVTDHCHIIGKYRASVHRDCNTTLN